MGAHARTRARAAPRCRALRKRMIDAPLFTPTFRRPRLCCRLIDGMNHSARSAIRDPRSFRSANPRAGASASRGTLFSGFSGGRASRFIRSFERIYSVAPIFPLAALARARTRAYSRARDFCSKIA